MENRTLVDRALKKAEICEKKGDKEGTKKWLAFAEKCEETYDRHEKERNK